MIEALTYGFFTLKAGIEDHVAFKLHVRNFDGDDFAGQAIAALEDRGHAGSCNKIEQFVLIELFSNVYVAHPVWHLVARRLPSVARFNQCSGLLRIRPVKRFEPVSDLDVSG